MNLVENTETLVKNKIGTHQKFHIEEGVGIYLSIKEGSKINCYPKSIIFVGDSLFKRDPETHYLGVGGGRYDEHSLDGDTSKNGESSISILAKDLGIDSSSPYYNMVQYAHINDTQGSKNQCELGNIMKEMFNQNYIENEVWSWLRKILDRKTKIEVEKLDFKFLAKKIRGQNLQKAEILKELFSFNIKGSRRINRIVLSKTFNFNDLVATRIVMNFGYKRFGTTDETNIVYVDADSYSYQKNDLCIGLNEGLFSVMPAQKMSKLFNIDNRDGYYQVMKYVKNINNRTGYHPFELAALLVDSHLVGVDPDESFEIFGEIYDLYIEKQKLYHLACAEIRSGFFNNGTTFLKVKIGNQAFKIGILHTDRNDMVNPAFMEFQCDLVVLKNSKGNVVILPKDRKFSLNVVMKRLQIAELKKKGFDMNNVNYDSLGKKGTLSICSEWHLQEKNDGGQLLLNGSLTHTMISPTKISLKFIQKVLEEATQDFLKK